MVNVEVRKNKEGYEWNLNTLIYSELLMSNVRFLVTNQICRVPLWKSPPFSCTDTETIYYRSAITPKTTSFLLRKAIQAEYF